jgi:hypothetical protein
MSASARSNYVLDRFPRHWDANRPGKLIHHVVNALGSELDRKATQAGRVRQAHRLDFTSETRDLLLLAALHGFAPAYFDGLKRRLTQLAAVADALEAAGAGAPAAEQLDAAAITQAQSELTALLHLDPALLVPGELDPREFAARLLTAVLQASDYETELDFLRWQFRQAISTHRAGNGTIEALLRTAATYLLLDFGPITHSEDGYLHLSVVRDHTRLTFSNSSDSGSGTAQLTPLTDFLLLEENPLEDLTLAPLDHMHRELFTVVRNGFEEVGTSINIVGRSTRTVGPMLVNIQTGDGVWYDGSVPDGATLHFATDGQVLLEGSDVSASAYSFSGAVFADATGAIAEYDFVFGDDEAALQPARVAVFSTTLPVADGFSVQRARPHAPGLLRTPSLAVGTTRFKLFVQVGHFGSDSGEPPQPTPAVAIHQAGIWNDSLFADPGTQIVAAIGFEWQERQAFSVVFWLPERFQSFEAATPRLSEQLKLALGRHRAAGVRLEVKYASPEWVLPDGILRDAFSDEVLGLAIHSTGV